MGTSGGAAMPHDHAVCFYDHDEEIVAAIARYVSQGLANGECVVVLATAAHRDAVDALLEDTVDLPLARSTGSYLTFDAADTLATLMVDGAPDPDRFMATVGATLAAARAGGRPVRAFGEMVALLWERSDVLAAIELEALWNRLAAQERFSLMCAYQTAALHGARLTDVGRVCELHTAVLPPLRYDSSSLPGDSPGGPAGGRCSEVFVPVPEAVAALRRFIAGVLELWDESHLAWEATLVASELATNAINHGCSPFRASIGRAGDVVRIGIEDVGVGRPLQRSAQVDDSDGRGMEIIEALSHRWGWDVLPHGKLVWAELTAVPRPG